VIEFLDEARTEFTEAFDWYLSQSDSAADRFQDEIDRAIAKIAAFPQRYATCFGRYRRHRLISFPYSIIYMEDDRGLTIYAIAHAKDEMVTGCRENRAES
jgi:plasmid stabilization system protein ParE